MHAHTPPYKYYSEVEEKKKRKNKQTIITINNIYTPYITGLNIHLTHTIPKSKRKKTGTENKQVLESVISFAIHI